MLSHYHVVGENVRQFLFVTCCYRTPLKAFGKGLTPRLGSLWQIWLEGPCHGLKRLGRSCPSFLTIMYLVSVFFIENRASFYTHSIVHLALAKRDMLINFFAARKHLKTQARENNRAIEIIKHHELLEYDIFVFLIIVLSKIFALGVFLVFGSQNTCLSSFTLSHFKLTDIYSSSFSLSDDCLHILQSDYQGLAISNDADDKKDVVHDFYLHLIQIRLEKNNISFTRDISLVDFDLSVVQQDYEKHHNNDRNRLLREEQSYQINTWNEMWTTLNTDQTAAAKAIWNVVSNRNNQLFFLNDYNNIDKIMLQNTVLRRVRDEFKMAIAVTSSGIAAILL